MFVCNCNGIRARDVLAAVESGAMKPAAVFQRSACTVQCGRCLPEIRAYLQQQRDTMKLAAQ